LLSNYDIALSIGVIPWPTDADIVAIPSGDSIIPATPQNAIITVTAVNVIVPSRPDNQVIHPLFSFYMPRTNNDVC
jgi:hypothetical protein